MWTACLAVFGAGEWILAKNPWQMGWIDVLFGIERTERVCMCVCVC